ncbi:hypothetical protein [Aerococcus sp. HMSC10H05]|uniref:hypothetical protein n=1 Tax=Aerococcus sp. HMSC10H05 TaxID=1581084 RepID=UPI0008A30558|nr:hypothetical protein [Aerococcus sp. HMSC10H05]OFU49897.1 hypothetical protein HMPREF3116_06685 [Aerococcus sp. HMSC10H05]
MQELVELPEKYQLILSAIPIGSATMISKDELVILGGITDREFYLLINDLIMKYGIVICSSRDSTHSGYYIPETEEEKLNGIRSLEEQANSMILRANKVRNSDIQTAQAYKEKYKLTPANRPIQTTFKFDYERKPTKEIKNT